MQQITLNIDNDSILPSLRKVLKAIPGVSIVRTTWKLETSVGKTSFEKAMDDIRDGRIYEYDSLDSLIKEMEK